MIQSTDQLNRKLEFPAVPRRIVSLVPSQTELLFDLGLREEVAGITRFCVHPDEWLKNKTQVGGTKKLNLQLIRDLDPDLILANKEENKEEDIKDLMTKFNVWISDIKNLSQALEMIDKVSILTNTESAGQEIIRKIRTNFQNLQVDTGRKIRCAYLIWYKPLMTVGGDTFISDMLSRSGYVNVFEGTKRYPEVTPEEIRKCKPEVIFLSSEPYPHFEKKLNELAFTFQGINLQLVDGEMFSWYGSRLQKAPGYFTNLRAKVQSAL
jgi:ABC-type Fe3+-hydroxamate transport system substrate-binding protein